MPAMQAPRHPAGRAWLLCATVQGQSAPAGEAERRVSGTTYYARLCEAGQTTVKTNMDHVYSCQYRTHSPVCVSRNYGHTRVNARDGRDDSAHVLSKPLWSLS